MKPWDYFTYQEVKNPIDFWEGQHDSHNENLIKLGFRTIIPKVYIRYKGNLRIVFNYVRTILNLWNVVVKGHGHIAKNLQYFLKMFITYFFY